MPSLSDFFQIARATTILTKYIPSENLDAAAAELREYTEDSAFGRLYGDLADALEQLKAARAADQS
jgi:hypothetical protein